MFLILLLLTTVVVGTNSSYHSTKVKTVKYPPTHKPVRHPPVHERVKHPPDHKPVKYPPTHKPVKYPPTHKPVKHPPVHESKKHPPVHEPERHPRVETHVTHPPDEKVHIVHTQQHPGNRTSGTHHPESIGNNNTKHTTTQDPNYIRNKTETHHQQNTGGSLYPPSNGLSGNDPQQTTTQYNTNNVHKTEIHHHHYSPPQQIGYGSGSYPVYHAPPPDYVYEYRNSRSRFANLLTGLALYNLGRMSRNRNNDANRRYVGSHGEVCKLLIVKRNGDYEEAGIDCQLMTSFIWESSSDSNHITDGEQTSTVMTSEVKVTQTNSSAGNSSVTTVTTTNTTLVDAREVKGESIEVTPDMRCHLIRKSRVTAILKKEVECGLLQAYALSSWQNSAEQLAPVLTLLVFQVIFFAVI